MLQHVLTPAMSRGHLDFGLDQVSGYVIDPRNAPWATTPAQIHELHGLGFPGSPFDPDQESIDVIRFAVTPFTQVVVAGGGNEPSENATFFGPFIDHPPFRGNGFAPLVASARAHPPVPVWWMDPSRLPAGTEMFRIHRDKPTEFIAVYRNAATGWMTVGPMSAQVPQLPSDVLGVFGTWSGERCLVDLASDGTTIVSSFADIPGAELDRGERGLFWREVDAAEVTDVHELRVTCQWRGAPFLLTTRWQEAEGIVARLFFLGRNALVAEAMRLTKTGAGVYEATVPISELTKIEAKQLTRA